MSKKSGTRVKWLKNFSDFKKEMERIFGATNEIPKVIYIIQRLEQKILVVEYIARFN